MRIVGGRHRGRRLLAPPGDTVRPTSDRARQALFNILSHGRLAADGISFAGAAVLDAFAGTGALGLEALSRGAAEAVFFERDPEAVAVLRRNVDPPYRSGLAASALEALDRTGWLAPDALAIVELGKREELVPPAAFTFLDERVYGTARLVFLRRKNNENRDVGAEFGRSDAKIIS